MKHVESYGRKTLLTENILLLHLVLSRTTFMDYKTNEECFEVIEAILNQLEILQ